jgi:hypothetical protein
VTKNWSWKYCVKSKMEKIVTRFQPIRRVSDFTDSQAGVEKMDSICMMMIVIGESLKNLDKSPRKAPAVLSGG